MKILKNKFLVLFLIIISPLAVVFASEDIGTSNTISSPKNSKVMLSKDEDGTVTASISWDMDEGRYGYLVQGSENGAEIEDLGMIDIPQDEDITKTIDASANSENFIKVTNEESADVNPEEETIEAVSMGGEITIDDLAPNQNYTVYVTAFDENGETSTRFEIPFVTDPETWSINDYKPGIGYWDPEKDELK